MYAKVSLRRSRAVALFTILTAACIGAHAAPPQPHPGWLGAAAKAGPETRATRDEVIAAARAALASHGGHGGDADDVRVLRTKAGTHVVVFVPRIGGVEVAGARTSVLLDRQLVARAITGSVAPPPAANTAGFKHDAGAALKLAALSVDGLLATSRIREIATGGDVTKQFALDRSVGFLPSGPARVTPIWFPADDGARPAWRVMLTGARPGEPMPVARSVVVSAEDGRVFADTSLISEHAPFSYRVFATADGAPYTDNYGYTAPHPTGLRDGWRPTVPAPMNLVTRVHAGLATGDPWLADDATETVGNNIDAFFDAVPLDEDGWCYDTFVEDYNPAEGDLRASVTGARTFDYAFDTNDTHNDYMQCPDGLGVPVPTGSAQLNAKIVQMFYTANWLHDYFYELGFDEAAGNMQRSNYGRGGIEGDPVIVHAGANGAYTYAPPEGISPVITLGINPVSTKQRDSGTFDFGVFVHEWTHAVMSRFVPFPDDWTVQYGALGEGTADYFAQMLVLRGQDRHAYAGKPAFYGAYPGAGAYANLEYDYPRDPFPPAGSAGHPDNSYYHGVRRFPYSADLAINPLTFRRIGVDNPLPPDVVRFDWKLRSLANASIHTAGEVWASAMWQCSRNILAAAPPHAFEATRDRILSHVLAGLALFPHQPTYTQARDAMLSAIRADDEGDYRRCRAGFATRGMGAGAVAPGARSIDLRGVVESSLDAEHALSIVDVALVETAGDGDGILDRGETGRLDVTVQNTGFSPATAQLAAAPYLGGYALPNGGVAAPATIAPGTRRTIGVAVNVTSRSGRANLPLGLVVLDTSRPWVVALKNASFLVNADRVRDRNVDDIASDLGFAADWTTKLGPRVNPANNCYIACIEVWRRTTHRGAAAYRAADPQLTADTYLESVPFRVDTMTPLSVTLRHDYDFDRAPGDPLAAGPGAGRVWISTDGQNWQPFAQFLGASGDWTTSTVDFGLLYAGQVVRLRLQATLLAGFAPDPAYWAVSRIEVQGAEPVFTRLVDDVD